MGGIENWLFTGVAEVNLATIVQVDMTMWVVVGGPVDCETSGRQPKVG